MTSISHLPALYLCLASLFVGPLIHVFWREKKTLFAFIDGFTLASIVFLIFFHVLPESIHKVGWLAFPLAIMGLWLPGWFESAFKHKYEKEAHVLTLGITLLGLFLHTGLDGFSLGQHQAFSVTDPFLLALVLHRLPVGLAVWWLIQPGYGQKMSLVVLLFLSLSTVIGFKLGPLFSTYASATWVGAFESLVAGTLLHVLLHRHNSSFTTLNNEKRLGQISGWGALAGLAMGWFLTRVDLPLAADHHHHSHAVDSVFGQLFAESSAALLLAYLATGIIYAFLPHSSVRWMSRGGSFKQSIKGMVFGLPLPICSCGVVPIYRSLVKKGVPLSAGLAFFVATPELGLDAVLLSLPLLGPKVTLLRVGTAAIAALGVGWFLGSRFKTSDSSVPSNDPSDGSSGATLRERLGQGLKVSLFESVEHTGPWILVGLLIASLFKPLLDNSTLLLDLSPWLQIPLFAILGLPVYVCAAGATPFVAVLIWYGLSPGAAIAFLLTGPATNVTTFGLLSSLHSKKLAWFFGLTVLSLTLALSFLVQVFWGDSSLVNSSHNHHHEISVLAAVSSAALALLFILNLLRRGPRFLINQVLRFDHHSHEHEHDHNHNHEHEHHEHDTAESNESHNCCSS